MFLSRRGSVTVFICIVLAVLIPLSCILTDLARYSMAEKQAKAALKICAESMTAAYDRQLKEQYGLFALYPREEAAMEEEVFELLSRNLNTEASLEGASDLYGFKVREVKVIPYYNLSEPFVLKKQVAEFMKYRAPLQTVQEFYEKLKVMLGLMNEAETAEKKMELDKLMNDIRSSLVKLHFMLDEPLKEFNSGKNKTSIAGEGIKKLIECADKANASSRKANSQEDSIRKVQDEYIELYPSYLDAKNSYESAKSDLDKIGTRIDNKEKELSRLESALETADETRKQSLTAKIDNLKADISDLQEDYSHADNSCKEAHSEYMEKKDAAESIKKELDTCLSIVIDSLETSKSSISDGISELDFMSDHFEKHIRFNADLIYIIDELAPDLSELDRKSDELLSGEAEDDSAISDRVRGSLEKQLKCIRKETYNDIRSQLSANLQNLKKWKTETEQCLSVLKKAAEDCGNALSDAESIKKDPNTGKRFSGYKSSDDVIESVKNLDSLLSDLKSLNAMSRVYAVPAYLLEPAPNKVEYDDFLRWFNNRYENIASDSPKPVPENKDLKSVRESISSFVNGIGEEAEENGGGDIGLIAGRKEQLPSIKGPTGSAGALDKIGKSVSEASGNRTVNESPLDKPVEGLDTVNENEKNFFSYEMARILELGRLIRKTSEEGLEGLIESLYMNEYIVSAFKSAVTENNETEHDIGWGRPLDRTFFDKAEVEYILFGKDKEASNLLSSKMSLFSIRLVFNLLHVYSDPEKLSATLTLASSIAGWTIFGVPVVQNFLLISWAGMESYLDAKVLLEGRKVPLIKTSSSWYLEPEKLAGSLKDIFLKGIREFADDKLDEKIDDASEALQETVTSIIDSKIDKAFAPFEKAAAEVTDSTVTVASQEIDTLLGDFLSNLSYDDMDSFSDSFETAIDGFMSENSDKLKSYLPEKLAKIKSSLKERVKALIFDSQLYNKLEDKVRSLGDKLLNKGFSAAEGQVDKIFGKLGSSNSNNITGRLVMTDYTDYLRLMLLAVPENKKALRTADLIQLNMQEVSENYEFSMDQYRTFVFINADLDFNAWFLPEELFKKNNAGMIHVEWCQGY